MDENSKINGISEALDFCSERLGHHQNRSQLLFMIALTALTLGGAIIFQGYLLNIRPENTSSNLTVAAFSVVAFGVLMALHRYHLTEISKYEHYKLAFARLNIAQNYNDKSIDAIIVSLTSDAFNFKNVGNASGSVQSPLPGHPASDLTALLLSKLMENAKSNDKEANKSNTL